MKKEKVWAVIKLILTIGVVVAAALFGINAWKKWFKRTSDAKQKAKEEGDKVEEATLEELSALQPLAVIAKLPNSGAVIGTISDGISSALDRYRDALAEFGKRGAAPGNPGSN